MNMPNEIPESIGGATRNLYRNASSTPAIMRVSPFGGWDAQRKTYRGLEGAFTGNVATAHGHQHESAARAAFVAKTKVELRGPERVILGDYAASLDGLFIEDGETWLLEIKCPFQGKKAKIWRSVMDFADPSYYFFQIQHQLMCVPEAKGAYLWVYDAETGDACECEVLRDELAIKEICAQWDLFWAWMQTDEPDPNVEQWVERKDDPWHYAAKRFLEAKRAAEKAAEEAETLRKELIELAEGDKVRGAGVTVVKSERIGNVNYKAIPELKGVDLDKYRGKSSEVITVKEI